LTNATRHEAQKISKSTKTNVPFDMKVIDVYTPSDIRTFRHRRDEDVDIAMCYDWIRIRHCYVFCLVSHPTLLMSYDWLRIRSLFE
jgi:hypothetical protein